MASPPYGGATSPPAASPLALPRQQRPTLALPGKQSRKPSIASAASSTHPLRQTSFPPPDSLEAQHALAEDHALAQYSPSAEGSLDDFSDDNEIRSAISGPAGEDSFTRKRKRPGEKRPRGRPTKQARAGSAINGDDARSQTTGANRRGGTAGAPSVIAGDDADAEAEDEDDDEEGAVGTGGRVPLYEGGQMTPAEVTEALRRRNAFYESVPKSQQMRYDSFSRSKLRVGDVRKLVNQTLTQSVPQNVVLAVSAYAKMFAGMLIEEARGVQAEWTAVEERGKELGGNKALERLRKSHIKPELDQGQELDGGKEEAQSNGETNGLVKNEPTSPESQPTVNGTQSKPHLDDVPPLHLGGAGGLDQDVEEYDRGPLLPDHLREALRRYKKRRAGGPVGFTGLSLEGRENAAPKMGGRRLFR